MNPVLRHPVLTRLATELGTSSAQVALRWAVHRGAAVIPRSTSPAHIARNLDIWSIQLSEAQLARSCADRERSNLKSLGKGVEEGEGETPRRGERRGPREVGKGPCAPHPALRRHL